MANKLLLKRSSVSGKVPTTSDLDYGELSVNYADGLLYYRTSANTIGVLNSGGGGYGNTQVAAYLPTYSGTIGGDITIGGNLAATGNVAAQYFIGDGTYLTGLTPSAQQYLFSSTASDISPYYQAAYITDFDTGSPSRTTTVTVGTSGTLLASFLTTAGHPGTTIVAGTVTCTYETTKASGNKAYTTYFELWKRTSGGAETKLLTSDSSTPSTNNTLIQQSVTLLNTATISLSASDRVLVKIYAYTASGTDSITLNWGDNTNTGFVLPTAAASASRFVPYNNATADINLGQYSLTSTANIGSGNITANSGVTSLSTTTGALVVTGGAGISGALYINNAGDVSANLGTATTNITTLFSNAASQATSINTINANIGAYELYANANIGTIKNNLSTLDANVGSYQTWANSRITTLDSNLGTATTNITTLFSNAASQATTLNTLDANLGTATTNITTLFSNAASQATSLNTLDANLGTATTNITTLFSNAASQATSLNTLDANLGTATTNITTLFSNAASQAISINTINANLGAYETWANSRITTLDANLGTATTNITTLFSNAATQATTLNTLDANLGTATTNITTLFSNAATQQTQINNIVSTANANTAAYLPSYTGSIGATAIGTLTTVTAGEITISGNSITSTNAVISIDPSTAGIGGTVVIAGNLQVTGTTTTVNSTTVEVSDLNVVLAKDAVNDAAANGAGITVKGANDKTFIYASSGDKWTMNKPLDITGGLTASANTAVNSTLYAQGVYDNSNRVLTSVSTTSALTTVGTLTGLTVSGSITPNANLTVNLGTSTAYWGTVYAGQHTGNTFTGGAGGITTTGTATASRLVVTSSTSPGGTNSGIYTGGSGKLTLVANGYDALTAYTSSYVGIYNTSPTARLHISASGNFQGDVAPTATNAFMLYSAPGTVSGFPGGLSSFSQVNVNSFLRGTLDYGDIDTSVGITTAATVFIENAPAAGVYNTISNAYALYIAAGTSYFGGGLISSGNTVINSTLYGRGVYDNSNRVVSTSSGAGNLTISGNAITLPSTGPGAASVGSSTAIPVVTTDAYGRVASTSTAAVVAPAGTLSGSSLASGVTASSLTSVGTLTGLTVSGSITPSANLNTNLGTSTLYFGTVFAGQHTGNTATLNAGTGNAIVATGVITPSANLNTNLGTSTLYFGTVFAGQHTGNAFTVGGGGLSSSGSITPSANVTQNLGSATAYWGTVFAGQHTGNAFTAGGGGITSSGNIVAAATTTSTSTTTGALVVKGGVGIGGSLNIGTGASSSLTGAGALTVTSTTDVNIYGSNTTDSAAGSITLWAGTDSGAGTPGHIYLKLGSGSGGDGSIYLQSSLSATLVQVSSSPTNVNLSAGTGGPLIVTGGARTTGNLYIGGAARIVSANASTSITTGALVVGGGIGISGNINVASSGGNSIVAAGTITGTANVTQNLGSSSIYWGTAYAGQFTGNTATLNAGTGNAIVATGVITPSANLNTNLGTSTLYFGTTYTGQLTANTATLNAGTGNAIVATGVITPSANLNANLGTSTLYFNTVFANTATIGAGGITTSGNITGNTNGFSIGYLNIPINSQSAAYTTVLSDSGKMIYHPLGDTLRTYTIANNASVAYTLGTTLTFVNMSANVVTIAITTDTMYLAGTGATGSRTLAQYGMATAVKLASTTWLISGSGLT